MLYQSYSQNCVFVFFFRAAIFFRFFCLRIMVICQYAKLLNACIFELELGTYDVPL